MEFERLSKEEIEINLLKSKIDSLDSRIQFLEKNWIYWTNSTKDIGQKLMVAMEQQISTKQ